MRPLSLILGSALLLACQLPPPSPAVDGGVIDAGSREFMGAATLAGPTAFNPRGALEGHNVNTSGQPTGFSFFITDHGQTCGALEALDGGRLTMGFRQIYAGVIGPQPNDGPPVGSYQVLQSFPPGGGFAAFLAQSTRFEDGGQDGPYLAQSGTLTFTTSGSDRVAGTFDVLVATDGGGLLQLSGTFDAPFCP
jgi:hypothetical protein